MPSGTVLIPVPNPTFVGRRNRLYRLLSLQNHHSIMNSATETFASVDSTTDQVISEKFSQCLQEEAEKIKLQFSDATPMRAQAQALIWLDTLARLHEAGMEEAITAQDAAQASAWTRDLSLIEVVISLIRNIQPMDFDGSPQSTGSTSVANQDDVAINV